jgi:hypothetical protein
LNKPIADASSIDLAFVEVLLQVCPMGIIERKGIAGFDFLQAQSCFFAFLEITSALKVSQVLYLIVGPA